MRIELLLLVTFLISMGARQPLPPIEKVPVEPVKEVNVEGNKPFLTVSKCDNCTVAEFDRILKAAVKASEVVSSSCFKDNLVKRSLIQTNGKTPLEVVNSLIHAGINIEAEMYWTSKRVLGYTYEGVQKEWINRRYMMEWNVCDLASLLAHETSHKAGYKHDYYATKNRPYSVPYSINFVFGLCCEK